MVTVSSGCCKGFPSCFLVLSFTLAYRMSVTYFFKISNRFWLNWKENHSALYDMMMQLMYKSVEPDTFHRVVPID